MEVTKTIAEHTVPEEIQVSAIKSITFIPGNLVVVIRYLDENDEAQRVTADMADDWAALSVTKKTDWKAMFKKLVAKALGTTVDDITGDIWD